MNYQKQLLDPRWQKKRLRILERDNWMCTLCGDNKSTLHIHHTRYGTYAWEVDDEFLKTRCCHCHLLEEYYKENYSPDYYNKIIKVSKKESYSNNIILYVYRIANHSENKLLDIFIVNKDAIALHLDTIFCEKDMDSFFDFITSIKQENG